MTIYSIASLVIDKYKVCNLVLKLQPYGPMYIWI